MKIQKIGFIIAFFTLCAQSFAYTNDVEKRSSRGRSQRGLDGEDEGRYVSRRTRERGPIHSRADRPEGEDDGSRKINFDRDPGKNGPSKNNEKKPERKRAGDLKKGRGKNPARDDPKGISTQSSGATQTEVEEVTTTSTGRNSASDESKRGRDGSRNPTKDDSDKKKIVRDKSPRNFSTTMMNQVVPVVPVMNAPVPPQGGNLVPALTCQREQCVSQPSEMRFYFTGNSCRDSYNHMGGNFVAYQDSLVTTTSYLFVHDATRGDNVFYSGRVTPGETILIDNDTLFPTELMVTVYDVQVTQILQMFKIRSDCQANLVIGDTFCGVMARQISSPVQGTFGTCVPSNTYTPGPGYSKSSKMGRTPIVSRGKSSKYGRAPATIPPTQSPMTQCVAPATMVRLQLTGGLCRASKPFNDQGKDFVCLLDRDLPMQSVRARFVGPSSNEVVFDQVVQMNDVIELTYNPTLPTTMTAQILALDGSTTIQVFGFNPSCSVPLSLGDRIGAFTVVGFTNQEQGTVPSGPAMPTVPTMPTMPTAPTMPSPTPGSTTPSSQCRGSLCTDPPRQLLFTFEGNSCASNKNSQGSGFNCAKDLPVTFPASVEITSTDMSVVGFSGVIQSKGALVTVGSGAGVLPGAMTMVVMDSAKMNILQTVTFQTDCQTNLFIGDFYGAIKLVEFTHQGGTFGGCRDAA